MARLKDSIRSLLQRRRGQDGELGQALVLTALAMLVILAMSAVGIDMATWYQKHHQAQVAADSAALAAANYMANGGSAPTATSTATTYAGDNQATIGNVTVDTATKKVTVSVSIPAPAFLANVVGIRDAVQTAQSTASWGAKTCASQGTSGGNCYAIFAFNSSAHTGSSTGPGAPGITNNGNGSTIINGTLHSNGSIYNDGYTSAFQGPDSTYGTTTGDLNANATLGSSTTPYPQDYTAATTATNYAQLPSGGTLTSATGTTAPTLTGCTYTAASLESTPVSGASSDGTNITLSSSWPSGVYCAPGTITIGAGSAAASGSNTGASYEANQIVMSGNSGTLVPYDYPGNTLLFYADYGGWDAATGSTCSTSTSTSTKGVEFEGNAKVTTEGDAFTPCSSIYFTSNNAVWSPAFLEGYNVNLAGNSFKGDGLQTNSLGTVAYTDDLSG
jgi:Flp pilus assembly protein TadG